MTIDHRDLEPLRVELSQLKELQTKLIKQATFGGMSKAEAEAYDARQQRIMEILAALEGRLSKN
jgi:uncharacterized protein with von Willebrand factor type A (vWA) domain